MNEPKNNERLDSTPIHITAAAPDIIKVDGTSCVVAYYSDTLNDQEELTVQLYFVGESDKNELLDIATEAVLAVMEGATVELDVVDDLSLIAVLIGNTHENFMGHSSNLICIVQDIDEQLTETLESRGIIL